MQRFIMTIGIPASGKSTWAKEFAESSEDIFLISERDNIRRELFTENTDNLNNYKFTKAKEEVVTHTQEVDIDEFLRKGFSVIVADTNLNVQTRTRLEKIAAQYAVQVEYKVFDTPLAECVKRNAKRNETVPERVLIEMDRKLRQYLNKPVYSFKKGLPNCIIVDVDGTLANHDGVRSPFEWSKVELDRPIKHTIRLIQSWAYMYKGEIIIFSGRDKVCYEDTAKWLIKNQVPFTSLYMRPEGNSQCDTIIKEKLFTDHIYNKYNVDFVMDDRKKVCMMWESIGLNVVNVGGFCADF